MKACAATGHPATPRASRQNTKHEDQPTQATVTTNTKENGQPPKNENNSRATNSTKKDPKQFSRQFKPHLKKTTKRTAQIGSFNMATIALINSFVDLIQVSTASSLRLFTRQEQPPLLLHTLLPPFLNRALHDWPANVICQYRTNRPQKNKGRIVIILRSCWKKHHGRNGRSVRIALESST